MSRKSFFALNGLLRRRRGTGCFCFLCVCAFTTLTVEAFLPYTSAGRLPLVRFFFLLFLLTPVDVFGLFWERIYPEGTGGYGWGRKASAVQ